MSRPRKSVKIKASREVFSKYFGQVKVTGIEVSSKVSAKCVGAGAGEVIKT